MNLSHIYVLNIKNVHYCYIINGISKNKSVKLLQYINLTEKMKNYGKTNINSNCEAVDLLEILI